MDNITLADAKAHLSEVIEQVLSGEAVCITRRGKPVARIVAVETPRQRIDLSVLRSLTDRMPMQTEGAGDFVRRMRDEERY